jgi:hypothetical protein
MRAQTVYLAACAAFLLLSIPPEIGRLDLRETNLLLAFLGAQLVAVTYLSSAVASSEIAADGEKGVPDLAMSAFQPAEIATGKVASSAAYAAYLVAIGLPLTSLAAALRGAALSAVLQAGVFTWAVGTAAGTWGAWLGARFSSEFTRGFVHWVLLGGLLGGTMLLPRAWWVLSPLRVIEEMLPPDGTLWAVPAAAGYLALAGAGAALINLHVRASRRAAGEV